MLASERAVAIGGSCRRGLPEALAALGCTYDMRTQGLVVELEVAESVGHGQVYRDAPCLSMRRDLSSDWLKGWGTET